MLEPYDLYQLAHLLCCFIEFSKIGTWLTQTSCWHAALGGCFVEGDWLRNAFRWKDTVGPWEERPGHFGDVWLYWTDDGLGYYEFLQVGIS